MSENFSSSGMRRASSAWCRRSKDPLTCFVRSCALGASSLWSGLNCVLMGWDFSGRIQFWFEGWCRGLEGEMHGGGVWRSTTLFPVRGTQGVVALWNLTMNSWRSGSTLKKKICSQFT